ncbi:cytidine deaminase-like protein, partial [Clavulina sp. PMI_390]
LTQAEREALIDAAFAAKEFAYNRHSNFRVGAALLTRSGAIIGGCSVDNASYGLTICAERTALVKAVSNGMTEFKALAVVADIPAPISPCGICRQFIREFCTSDMPILMI